MFKNLFLLLIITVFIVTSSNVLAFDFTEPTPDEDHYYLDQDSDGNPVYLDEENTFSGSTYYYWEDETNFAYDSEWYHFRVAEGDTLTSILLTVSNLVVTPTDQGDVLYTKLLIGLAETVGWDVTYHFFQFGGGADYQYLNWPTEVVDILDIPDHEIGSLDAGYYSVAIMGRYVAVDDASLDPWDWEYVHEGGMTADYRYDLFVDSPSSTPVPEPATMLLLGSGLVGLAGLRRKFKK